MNRIFVTHILPPHLIDKYRLSTAACNFSFNLMSGSLFQRTFSLLGTYVGGVLDTEAYSDNRFTLFYNTFFRTKGRVGIIIASLIEQWKIFTEIPRCSSVWLYNVTAINAFLFVLLRIFKRSVQVNVIVLDFTPVEKGLGLNNLFLKIINSCHGNIRLANSPLFTNHNSYLLPGVVPKKSGREPLIKNLTNKFLLSGVLNEQISQLSLVLEAFSRLPHCELHITGKICNDSLIRLYTDKFSNIKWHGNLPFKDYLEIMHSCTFQLSTRNPLSPENQCNFPSKIIETLLHNRIVISTINYPQIEGINYFVINSDIDTFVLRIQNIINLHDSELYRYANQSNKVIELFGTEVWFQAMMKIEKNI